MRAGNYLWLQTNRTARVAIYRVSVLSSGTIIYEPLFGGRIPKYAKHMVEVYCELNKEVARVG